ncbi:ribosomal protein S18-alanine N-acetyltransferase [uncultured Aquitalea sp.]|uniref:ribosomal protein S18-alanine N-acetyltransferase n=1 Tax=uncultured Aquitalea sp. TaxID=540272 RepID=UPI0025D63441|nr:ribosomal protein S18-alanine N-acetyltransferase [uncultured Aquitalea sp.]
MSSVVQLTERINPDWLSQQESLATPHFWSSQQYGDSLAAGHWFYALHEAAETGIAIIMPVAGEAELLNIFIAKDKQSQGLGKALLQGTMHALRLRGISRLLLEVRESNQPAHKLYSSLGFTECGRRKRYYPAGQGEREDAILMEANL